MNEWRLFAEGIDLNGSGNITTGDAARQTDTAREILLRLGQRPGVILADEVGMGKTFVSLAVAASVALDDPRRRPVVVMIPPGLKEKWPRDFAMFTERCLSPEQRARFKCGSATNGVEFLKLLDDPIERRRQIIFLTHGAMQRSLKDGWVRLAFVRQALFRRHGSSELKNSLGRCMGQLLWGMAWVDRHGSYLWEELLSTHPNEWARILTAAGIDLPDGDDPVPQHVVDVLERVSTDDLYSALQLAPLRDSSTYDERLQAARDRVTAAVAELWIECLRDMRIRLPLLILDEAHHLKNARTRLASLFHAGDSVEGSQSLRPKGNLGGAFERMLFLTATPFQLGHHELCSVVDRFDGIDWGSKSAPTISRTQYRDELRSLRGKLDRAQSMALNLSETWGRLSPHDMELDGVLYHDTESWWKAVKSSADSGRGVPGVVATVDSTSVAFRAAEEALRPWVIRHLRARTLTSPNGSSIMRRQLFPGAGILDDNPNLITGLSVEGRALLPFLLAARASLSRPDKRPVFAEGLASSYESFLHTRERPAEALDEDDEGVGEVDHASARAEWYLDQLNQHLPLKSYEDSVAHPKIAATADRVVRAWKAGEKVVVFCHFIRTGYALRRAISGRIRDAIAADAGEKLGMAPDKAFEALEGIGLRFFDGDSKARKEIAVLVDDLLGRHAALQTHSATIHEVVRRFLRTPSFLVRFFPLAETQRVTAESIGAAFNHPDSSGLSFTSLLGQFFNFLAVRCSSAEQSEILRAVNTMQTGGIMDKDAQLTFAADELGEERETLMANVRLVNGKTLSATRQRLMLTFNSPFFPEVLIASAVMAEGVDLHRYCRYVIHHDLCWNPSTLEQRTGRIDRIGAKVETARKSIHLYKPFLAATQDERQFQVVTDRERWFNIVMGAAYSDDVASTEKQANRLPLASAIAETLTFRLEVVGGRALSSGTNPSPEPTLKSP